jgi:hypothetical protein
MVGKMSQAFRELLRTAAKAIAEELGDRRIVRDEIVQEGERFYLRECNHERDITTSAR